MATYYIANTDVQAWLDKLASDKNVYAPVRQESSVVFKPMGTDYQVELNLRPTESAKRAIFPRSEELFRYENELLNEEQGGGRVVSVKEAEDPGEAVVFGALPCDARGFFAFDPVYDGSGTKGLFRDTYYLKRRDKTVIISKACLSTLSTCFCHWVGGSPTTEEGSDALAFQIDGGFLIKGLTDKGKAVLKDLGKASDDQIKSAEDLAQKVEKGLDKAPDLSKAKDGVLKHFEDADFWLDQSAQCISCGTCTYLCPTCYCFNITDETNGIKGVRLRSWDTCMSSLFTLEASGHNPRHSKADRLRNRVGHKFSYYPNIHGGRFSCVGCGRCIKSCPSMVDIRQIVLDAISQKPKEAAHV